MKYLYHLVPKNMQGDILYPLSDLKKTKRKLYKKIIEKYNYAGRTDYKDKIPYLNCKWEDVINLIAVNPKVIFKELKKAGGNYEKLDWYKIPVSNLDKDNLVFFLYRKDLLDMENYNKKENYKKFSEKDLKKYSRFPNRLRKYYKEEFAKGIRPFLFHTIPHILYHGEINVKDLEVIETK